MLIDFVILVPILGVVLLIFAVHWESIMLSLMSVLSFLISTLVVFNIEIPVALPDGSVEMYSYSSHTTWSLTWLFIGFSLMSLLWLLFLIYRDFVQASKEAKDTMEGEHL